jgi:hypothetical protein
MRYHVSCPAWTWVEAAEICVVVGKGTIAALAAPGVITAAAALRTVATAIRTLRIGTSSAIAAAERTRSLTGAAAERSLAADPRLGR